MSPVAFLAVKRYSGVVEHFHALDCRVADGRIEATGRWKFPSGRLSDEKTYSWPSRTVLEIRWLEAVS